MIGYTWWKRRFGGDAGVVGRQIQVNDETFTIAGVMPQGFEFPPMGSAEYRPVIWMSLNLPVEQERARGMHSLAVVARLKAGASIRQAQAEMDTIVAGLAKAYPQEDGGCGVRVTSLTDVRQLEDVRPALLLVMAAAALVLLIACANIANLLVGAQSAAEYRKLLAGHEKVAEAEEGLGLLALRERRTGEAPEFRRRRGSRQHQRALLHRAAGRTVRRASG